MHWSKTRHASYAKCPRHFFYANVAAPLNERIAALTKQDSIHLLRHNIVKDILLGLIEAPEGEIPVVGPLIESGCAILTKASKNEADAAGQASIVEQCVNAFVTRELPDLRSAKVLYTGSEGAAEFVYDGLAMMAAPEVAVDRGAGIEVLSFKTGGSRFRREDETLWRAGGLTAWVRSSLKIYDRPVQVTEVFLREDCLRVDVILSDERMREFVTSAREAAKRYSASAKIGDFPAQPDINGCRFCEFQSVCPEYQDFAEVTYDLAALRQAAGGTRGKTNDKKAEIKDVFLCHVSSDKEGVVRPVARALEAAGISYWLDEAEILVGDSIIKMMNDGLAKAQFLLCFLSESFVGHGWPQAELESALSAEFSSGNVRVLPVMVGDPAPILNAYPLLKQKRYAKWDDGIDVLVEEIRRVLEREKRRGR